MFTRLDWADGASIGGVLEIVKIEDGKWVYSSFTPLNTKDRDNDILAETILSIFLSNSTDKPLDTNPNLG